MSTTTPFPNPIKQQQKNLAKVISTVETQLQLAIRTMKNDTNYFVCAVLIPGQLLPCLKQAVADPLSKYVGVFFSAMLPSPQKKL